jgi:hypothetical protein
LCRNRLLGRHRHAKFGVILLALACLGLGAAGPGGPAVVAATTALVIPMICAPIGRDVAVIGPVNSHRTSPSLRGAGMWHKESIS